MALLASYILNGHGKSLSDYLDEVFATMEKKTLSPTEEGSAGFAKYMENYKKGLAAQYALN